MLTLRTEEFLRLVGIKWEEIDGVVVRLTLAAGLAGAPSWDGFMLAGDFEKFASWRAAQPGNREQQRNAFLALPAPFFVPALVRLLPYIVPFPCTPDDAVSLRAAHEWLAVHGCPTLARLLTEAHPEVVETNG
jgi:hypothetical protein